MMNVNKQRIVTLDRDKRERTASGLSASEYVRMHSLEDMLQY